MLVVNWVVATCWRTEIQLIILASFLHLKKASKTVYRGLTLQV